MARRSLSTKAAASSCSNSRFQFSVFSFQSFLKGLLVGVIAAAAASTKAYVIFVCLPLPLLWMIRRERFVTITAGAALAGIVCLTPWTVINYRASDGHFVPFAAVAGEVFLDGTNPEATGTPSGINRLPEEVERGKHPIEIDRMRRQQAFQYVKDSPAWYAKLLVKKFAKSFSPARDFLFQFNGQDRFFGGLLSRWGITAFNGILLLLILSAAWFLRRSRPGILLWSALFGSALFVQLLFCAYTRYRFPFYYSLIPCVAVSLRSLLDHLLALRRAV